MVASRYQTDMKPIANKSEDPAKTEDEVVPSLLRLPRWIWEKLDAEAAGMDRSRNYLVKQILKKYIDGDLVSSAEYQGITPADALKYKRLAEQLGTERAKELADFDAAQSKKRKTS